mgnify:CR=1 FL=1
MTDSKDDELTYRDAGVDLDAADEAVDGYKEAVRNTRIDGVLDEIGGFGGLFSLAEAGLPVSSDYEPVLVAGADGVGTKLRIAFQTGVHDTIGIDCVAMCVNDVITTGARPLFFLDYLSTGVLDPGQTADIVRGMAEGCREAGCALLGGETAEMPGFYPEGEYDIAGFCVGVVDGSSIVRPESVRPGDAIVGIDSSGIHSNGFSLVRKVLDERAIPLDEPVEELEDDRPLGEVLLEPTLLYADHTAELRDRFDVHGFANVTGGGLEANVARALPDGVEARIDRDAWETPPVFEFLRERGNIPIEECYRVFNMGIGFTVIVPEEQASEVCETLKSTGLGARVIGSVRRA